MYFVSIVPPPPRVVPPVIAAEGENITLSCPLQTAPGLERFYNVQWRYPEDMCIVECGSQPNEPWARFNDETLELTVGPYNSDVLPSEFQCVSVSFRRGRMAALNIGQTTIGTVLVITPCKFPHMQHINASPHVCMCVCMQHILFMSIWLA